MSVPQIPQAATLIKTSPSPTSGTGTSSTRTIPFSRYTPARIVLGIGPIVLTCSTTVPAPLIAPPPRSRPSQPHGPPSPADSFPEMLPAERRPAYSAFQNESMTAAPADSSQVAPEPSECSLGSARTESD